MQLTAVLASLLATASAMNSGHHRPSRSVTVTLRNDSEQAFNLREPRRRAVRARPPLAEPISEVELTLGDHVRNADLRCQILDEEYQPIVVLRGANTDVTFADGDKGPWKLREPTVVRKIVCDQDFEQIQPDDERLQVSVLLQSQSPEVGIPFDLSGVVANEIEVAEPTAIETVTLDVIGELVDPALRCQLVGAEGPIVVLRGENVDVTFADGEGGPWTLQEETVVQKIVCDPAFEKGSA